MFWGAGDGDRMRRIGEWATIALERSCNTLAGGTLDGDVIVALLGPGDALDEFLAADETAAATTLLRFARREAEEGVGKLGCRVVGVGRLLGVNGFLLAVGWPPGAGGILGASPTWRGVDEL